MVRSKPFLNMASMPSLSAVERGSRPGLGQDSRTAEGFLERRILRIRQLVAG
jgi:hypothetical protein